MPCKADQCVQHLYDSMSLGDFTSLMIKFRSLVDDIRYLDNKNECLEIFSILINDLSEDEEE